MDTDCVDTRDLPFNCAQCAKGFVSKELLDIHTLRMHTKLFQYQCKECKFRTHNREMLEFHSSSHTTPRAFACQDCDFTCPFESELLRHQVDDCGKHLCKMCEFQTSDPLTMQLHSETHQNRYPCASCNFTSQSLQGFAKHKSSCSRKSKAKYPCNNCSFVANTRAMYERHVKKIHNPKRIEVFSCKYCTYTTDKKNFMTSHELTHTKNKKYKCDKCSYSAIRSDYLQKHIATHQKTHRPFKCHLCEYTAVRNDYLKKHLAKHPPIKPTETAPYELNAVMMDQSNIILYQSNGSEFKCSLCEFYTDSSHEIEQHLILHNEPARMKCSQCRFRCEDLTRMSAHMKSHNRDEIKCVKCSFSSQNPSQMREHVFLCHNEHENIELVQSDRDEVIEIITLCDPLALKIEPQDSDEISVDDFIIV